MNDNMPLHVQLLYKNVRDMKLKTKIRLALFAISIFAVAGIGIYSYQIAKRELLKNSKDALISMEKQGGKNLDDGNPLFFSKVKEHVWLFIYQMPETRSKSQWTQEQLRMAGDVLRPKFKGNAFIKTVFFIPMALSPVLAAFVWGFIDRNILSNVLGSSLLGKPSTVLWGLIMIALWSGIGSNIMVYLAGLTNIPNDYYEAAAIDGVTIWQKFRYITLPLLGPSFTTCITLTLTSALREFGITMSATAGGPARSSEMISIFIYKNLFSFQKAGYGQAVSLVFMIILMVLGVCMNRFFRSKEVEL